MEIKNYTNAISAYKATPYDKTKSEKHISVSVSKNTDKVDFSSSKPKSLEELKSSISSKAESNASLEKIINLKAQISSGQYNIPSDTISTAILEG